MSTAVWRQLLLARGEILGPEHPCTRAAFGRWVGSRGGVLSAVGSGEQAWVANYRQRGYAGFRNRSWRRALKLSCTVPSRLGTFVHQAWAWHQGANH